MSDECIHGFDDGLCAVCSPQAVAAPTATRAAKTARKAPSRTARRPVTHSSAPGAVSTRAATPRTSAVDVSEQRLYHVTHIKNLAAIIESGRLLADSGEAGGATPVVDIATPEVRRARRETAIPGQTATVAEYVPFYLSPDAHLWNTVRTHGNDPRVSTEATAWAARDFVMVVTVAKDIFSACADSTAAAPYSVTDGDAAMDITRFGTGPGGTESLLRLLRADEPAGRMLNAEFLVKGAVPFELVTLVGVCNERVRDEVKGKLKRAGYRARVAVYPPWFQASEDDSD